MTPRSEGEKQPKNDQRDEQESEWKSAEAIALDDHSVSGLGGHHLGISRSPLRIPMIGGDPEETDNRHHEQCNQRKSFH
jgi:hypothetical protein